jgi:hypothetical protein
MSSSSNALLPPKFCGTDGTDVRKWMHLFDDYVEDAEWDDVKAARKLKLLLSGEAQLFVWDLPDSKQKSFKEVKKELLRQYGGTGDSYHAMVEFEARKRAGGETLRELCYALRLLHNQARPNDSKEQRDRDVRFRMLQLLPSNIREALLQKEDMETCELDTLLARADRLEKLAQGPQQQQQQQQRVCSSSAAQAPTEQSSSSERLDRLERMMEELVGRVQVTGTRGRRQKKTNGQLLQLRKARTLCSPMQLKAGKVRHSLSQMQRQRARRSSLPL